MSYTRYNASDLSIELIGEKDVARALGNCGKKAPLVIRNAVNETAKDARKVMIREAKKRYAVNGAGRSHLNDLKIRKRAKVSDLGAELHIGGPGQKDAMKNDLGYFKTVPSRPYVGQDVANAPDLFKAKVLKNSGMKPLPGQGNLSKGFLVEFQQPQYHNEKIQSTALAEQRWQRGKAANHGQPFGSSDASCDLGTG